MSSSRITGNLVPVTTTTRRIARSEPLTIGDESIPAIALAYEPTHGSAAFAPSVFLLFNDCKAPEPTTYHRGWSNHTALRLSIAHCPGVSSTLAGSLNCVITLRMARQSVITQKKKRGPKPTGKGTLIGVRIQPPALASLDKWASAQDDSPSRPEAIRRLVDKALGR